MTKGQGPRAEEGSTHVSRTRAGKSGLRENAEAVKGLRFPEGFGFTRLRLPGAGGAVWPEAPSAPRPSGLTP